MHTQGEILIRVPLWFIYILDFEHDASMSNKIMFVPFTIVSIVYCDDDADPAGAIGVRDGSVRDVRRVQQQRGGDVAEGGHQPEGVRPPFGRAEGTSFTASGRVVGFFGRSGELLDSIGVYTA